MKKIIFTCLSMLLSANSYAADTVLQLKDGRSIALHDDFTWEYVQPEVKAHQQSSNFDQTQPAKTVAAIPVVANPQQRLAQVLLGTSKNILQLNDSGVDVLFQAARYEQGELIIPVSITNNAVASVINVDISYQLFDSQGERILQDETSVWTSVKRLPETYLRPNNQAKGIALRIPVGQLPSYDFKAKIIDITTRN